MNHHRWASIQVQVSIRNRTTRCTNILSVRIISRFQKYIPLIEKRKIDSVGTDASYTKPQAGIQDWDSILKKGARTGDSVAVGIVTAVNDENVIITSDGAKDEFSIPKNEIQSYNGQEEVPKYNLR